MVCGVFGGKTVEPSVIASAAKIKTSTTLTANGWACFILHEKALHVQEAKYGDDVRMLL
jgi:hypothetical protein